MTPQMFTILDALGDFAAIATAVVAVAAYGKYLFDRRQQRIRLENYLSTEKQLSLRRRSEAPSGKHTVLHLVARLGMSENQIVDAAFRSKKVKLSVSSDTRGHAKTLLLEHSKSSRNQS